ncbi:Multicopper oxidase [Lampropedia hyalina DSM 16112]|uniref:Multicopper oxidase n=1 Tax=Lampropedia hyalina DSM 16112 TaxID=1122156 RepID=A0A1M4XHG9_9BURK|nr:multicopper oxidase domain-containing protein [Lampropedia hyalina]SHE92850.1 Multicopper oxidase [Lampropedia hyalina DSM 16112]
MSESTVMALPPRQRFPGLRSMLGWGLLCSGSALWAQGYLPPADVSVVGRDGSIRATAEAALMGLGQAREPGHEVDFKLRVEFRCGDIFNPRTGAYDRVWLRAYSNASDVRQVGSKSDCATWRGPQASSGSTTSAGVATPHSPFAAPWVEIWPGETFRLQLQNRMVSEGGATVDDSCPAVIDDHNSPHCFNSTNMHFHGGWVSPSGNSDNVLLKIDPGKDFEYEYNIPLDHPAGTFWYHTHLHGSTALQVSSGMAGAIVIRGDRQPRKAADGTIGGGDIDILTVNVEPGTGGQPAQLGEPFRERLALFQQIAYACRENQAADGAALPAIKRDGDNGPWVCNAGQGRGAARDVGGVEAYGDQLAPNSWVDSGRFTGINGEVHTVFSDVRAGEIQRWRLIHAGVRDSIRLRIVPFRADAKPLQQGADGVFAKPALGGLAPRDFASQTCDMDHPVAVVSIAADGLTRRNMVQRTDAMLQPGYREDWLVAFPKAGDYCIVDADRLLTQSVVTPEADGSNVVGSESAATLGGQIVGYIHVDAAGQGVETERAAALSATDAPRTTLDAVVDALVAAAEQRINTFALRDGVPVTDTAIRDHVVAALKGEGEGGVRGAIAAFTKHQPVQDAEITGYQSLGFRIVSTGAGGPLGAAAVADGANTRQTPRPAARVLFEVGEIGLDLASQRPIPLHSQAYSADRIDRLLTLGDVEEWEIGSFFAGHPFHIHVNPFEVVEVRKLDAATGQLGPDLSGPDWIFSPDNSAELNQYANLKGVWKDTLFLEQNVFARIRTRYERYIGDFVLHCHILDHEDNGMMQNVRIAMPAGDGQVPDVPTASPATSYRATGARAHRSHH